MMLSAGESRCSCWRSRFILRNDIFVMTLLRADIPIFIHPHCTGSSWLDEVGFIAGSADCTAYGIVVFL